MADLLFLPLDINVDELTFSLGNRYFYRQPYWETTDVDGRDDNYQKYQNLLTQLSIDTVTTFTHKIQQNIASAHIDFILPKNSSDNIKQEYSQASKNEPAGYHVVLKGNLDSLEIFDGKKWVNPILPKVPMVYLLNLTSCIHRVKPDTGRETLYIQGLINPIKHKKIIEDNLKIYGEYAVYKT